MSRRSSAAGVTVFEALEAHDALRRTGVHIRVIDLYSVQPIDAATLVRCARETKGRLITVEDHYAAWRHRRRGGGRGRRAGIHGAASRGAGDSAQRRA